MTERRLGKQIGPRLRERREELGLTQIQLAEAANLLPQRISDWERGRHIPDLEHIVPLAKALSTSVDDLIGREISLEKGVGVV